MDCRVVTEHRWPLGTRHFAPIFTAFVGRAYNFVLHIYSSGFYPQFIYNNRGANAMDGWHHDVAHRLALLGAGGYVYVAVAIYAHYACFHSAVVL